MPKNPNPDASNDQRRVKRYRDLLRRLQRLESMFDDLSTFDRIMASGRYFKLAVATAQAYEQIEKEFSSRKAMDEEFDCD